MDSIVLNNEICAKPVDKNFKIAIDLYKLPQKHS